MTEAARALTPLYFQRALADEVRKITEGMLFASPGGGDPVPMQVFCQGLPVPERPEAGAGDMGTIEYQDGGEEQAVFRCPWCLVRIGGGKVVSINGPQQVEVAVGFGIYSPSPENRGHEELLNLIQRVYGRFATDPLLDRQYTCSGEFEWELQDEDTWPYFFGAIGTEFRLPGLQRTNAAKYM